MNKIIVIKKYVIGIFLMLLLVTVGANIYFRYVYAQSGCDFDNTAYGVGNFGRCPAVAVINPTPITTPTPTVDSLPTETPTPTTTDDVQVTPTDEFIGQLTITPTTTSVPLITPTAIPTPNPIKNFINKLITQPGEEPAKIGLPLENFIDDIQKNTEDITPTIIRPVVQEAGAFGLVSLLLLIFDYALLLRFILLGGFLLPFLKLLFSKKGKGQIINFVTKEPVAFALIKITDPATGKVVKKSITNLKGRYSLHLTPGTYNVEVTHRGYLNHLEQITLIDSSYVNSFVQLEEDIQSSFSNKFQYSVYSSNPTLIIFLFSFTLSLINLVYVRTFGSIVISLMTTSVWIIFHKKKDVANAEIYRGI